MACFFPVAFSLISFPVLSQGCQRERAALLPLWSAPCRRPVGKKRVLGDSFQSSLSRLDPAEVLWCLGSVMGGPRWMCLPQLAATTKLAQTWREAFLCSLLSFGVEKACRYSRATKVSCSLLLSCSSDVMRAGWVNFGHGLKPRNVTERRVFAKPNKRQMFFEIYSWVDGGVFMYYVHSRNRKAIIFIRNCFRQQFKAGRCLCTHCHWDISKSSVGAFSEKSFLPVNRFGSDYLHPLLYRHGLNTTCPHPNRNSRKYFASSLWC